MHVCIYYELDDKHAANKQSKYLFYIQQQINLLPLSLLGDCEKERARPRKERQAIQNTLETN